ncbi:hypothetical protein M413DRAFT_320168 [Hebeloma cylindrosporum]|uniref:Protein kinase domain-containing protein n=1 Tax=Hebeloma cylindrosporum TaxID=76867 RepID=A0A0C2XEF3_HEBCY|nr:hypothetical protein M413DRAFT_320168 [Hebeloma cylindrosporum h7]
MQQIVSKQSSLDRSKSWELPIPATAEEWDFPNLEDPTAIHEHFQRIDKAWDFLRPSFASRGYALYEKLKTSSDLVPVVESTQVSAVQVDPYGRRIYESDNARMSHLAPRVWAARDRLGRDVVIKVVSNESVASAELKALELLNSEPLRSDPRNHTIHVVEFLHLHNFVFAVMPRWDAAFDAEFDTVKEVTHCAHTFLEAFEFLHEHRICHLDFLAQNAGYNVCISKDKSYAATGTRHPSEAKYAVYDFGGAILYPEETPLSITNPKWQTWGWRLRNIRVPTEPYNPFQFDMLALGLVLQRYVRHIEKIIPELGPFFDRMTDPTPSKNFTAKEALAEFRRIQSQLTPSQLSRRITTRLWRQGLVYKKRVTGIGGKK